MDNLELCSFNVTEEYSKEEMCRGIDNVMGSLMRKAMRRHQ